MVVLTRRDDHPTVPVWRCKEQILCMYYTFDIAKHEPGDRCPRCFGRLELEQAPD